MSSNFARPEQWYDLAAGLMRGDPAVAQQIVNYERQADNVFQRFTASSFAPVVVQNVTTMTYNTTTYIFSGYRIGQFVHLDFRCQITNAGAVGAISVTVPTILPIAPGGFDTASPVGAGPGPLGQMMVFINATGVLHHGLTLLNNTLTVNGWSSGNTNFMGVQSPALALASGDQVAYSLNYVTSATL